MYTKFKVKDGVKSIEVTIDDKTVVYSKPGNKKFTSVEKKAVVEGKLVELGYTAG